MAVPKTKHSKSRKNMRRSNVWRIDPPALSTCVDCGELKMPHRVCASCGKYKGRQVIQVEA
jgi:large subunit ribosomal protein L32